MSRRPSMAPRSTGGHRTWSSVAHVQVGFLILSSKTHQAAGGDEYLISQSLC